MFSSNHPAIEVGSMEVFTTVEVLERLMYESTNSPGLRTMKRNREPGEGATHHFVQLNALVLLG